MRSRPLLALLLASIFVGCDSQPDGKQNQSGDSKKPAAEGSESTGASKAEFKLATWAEVEQEIAKHEGKVVILDVWSTTCEVCLKELPHLTELQQAHSDDIVAITLNIDHYGDDPQGDELLAKAEKCLTHFKIDASPFINLVSTTPDEEVTKTLDAFAPPVVRVYDREGKLHKRFDDNALDTEFTYDEHITPAVEALLAE